MKKNNSAVTRWSEINIFLFFTHWLLELFAKNVFLGIMDIFSLDMGQISSNLLEKASATWQHTSCLSFHKHCILGHFYLGMGRNQNLEKVTYLFRLFIFFAMGCSRKNPCPPPSPLTDGILEIPAGRGSKTINRGWTWESLLQGSFRPIVHAI